mmetsp:Transcript_5497/g.16722  ORF Transcript_5497/g.16722 Transcript_5497/m.16722 type:complete len:219 (+) Transcript_5497:743-1399(+)
MPRPQWGPTQRCRRLGVGRRRPLASQSQCRSSPQRLWRAPLLWRRRLPCPRLPCKPRRRDRRAPLRRPARRLPPLGRRLPAPRPPRHSPPRRAWHHASALTACCATALATLAASARAGARRRSRWSHTTRRTRTCPAASSDAPANGALAGVQQPLDAKRRRTRPAAFRCRRAAATPSRVFERRQPKCGHCCIAASCRFVRHKGSELRAARPAGGLLVV